VGKNEALFGQKLSNHPEIRITRARVTEGQLQ